MNHSNKVFCNKRCPYAEITFIGFIKKCLIQINANFVSKIFKTPQKILERRIDTQATVLSHRVNPKYSKMKV